MRLTVRLAEQPALAAWLAQLGGEQSATARALIIIGGAALGLPDAAGAARRALAGELPDEIAAALLAIAEQRQPRGSHAAATRQPPIEPRHTAPSLAQEALLELPPQVEVDPLAALGIEV